MMDKLRKSIFWGVGSIGIFVVFVALILLLQGRLNKKIWQQITGRDQEKQEKEQPERQQEPASTNALISAEDYSMPSPFTFAEISSLARELRDEKEEYLRKKSQLETERKELFRIRDDIAERKKEVQILMEKTGALLLELEEKKRSWKSGQLLMEKGQEKNLKKLAKMFGSMDEEQAAERLGQMDEKTSAKILFYMGQRQSSKILANISPEKVNALTELMQNSGNSKLAN